jgi:hypothetical protein
LFCHIVKEFGLHIRKAYSLTYIQRSDNGHGHSSTTAGVDPGFQVKLKESRLTKKAQTNKCLQTMPSKKISSLFIITLHIFSHVAKTFNLHKVN